MGVLESLGLRSKPKTFTNPRETIAESEWKYIKEEVPKPVETPIDVLNAGFWWETPDVPFSTLYNYYKKDPGIQSAVNTYRNYIMGNGFYITANDERAKEIVEQWNRDTDFEKTLFVIAGDRIILGNCLVELVKFGDSFKLIPVDMRTIIAAQRDRSGVIADYIQQTAFKGQIRLPAKNFLHFKFNDIGRFAWSLGIFHSLAMPFFEYEGANWSLAEGIMQMREDNLRIIHKMASPKQVFTFPNVSEEWLKGFKERFKGMKAGESLFENQDFGFKELSITGQARFREYIEFLSNAYENGLQAPTAKIMTAAGISNATYASAQAAQEMFVSSLEGTKRKWKEEIEDLVYKPLLESESFDVTRTELEINWGLPDEPEIDLEQILAFRQTGDITQEEVRLILKNMGLPLQEEPTTDQQIKQAELEFLKKKIELLEKKERALDVRESLAQKLIRRIKE